MIVPVVCIASFVVGFLLAIWLFLFDASTNMSQIGHKTGQLLDCVPSEDQLEEDEKAWFFVDYFNYYGNSLEFDPARKSLRLFTKNYTEIKASYTIAQAENENFGTFAFILESDPETILIHKMNKTTKEIAIVKSVSSTDYDPDFIAVSGQNIVLFDKINGEGCQTIHLMLPDGQISGNGIPMLNCRQRSSCVASAASGDVYIFGIGETNSGDVEKESEKYDFDSGKFVTIGKIPDPAIIQASCVAIEHRGKIFVCENEGENLCASYDPDLDRWMLAGTFAEKRSYFQLESIGGSLYVVWGNYIKSIEKYNEVWGVWETYIEDMPDEFCSDYEFVSFHI